LGLDNAQVDVDTVRQITQDALKTAKTHYERETNEIKGSFAILGNEEKREAYDNQLLLQQDQATRREKASKQAKMAKARNEKKQGGFLIRLLSWILFLLVIAVLVKFYFENQELVMQWLASIGLPVGK
jgi:hypothetical protein